MFFSLYFEVCLFIIDLPTCFLELQLYHDPYRSFDWLTSYTTLEESGLDLSEHSERAYTWCSLAVVGKAKISWFFIFMFISMGYCMMSCFVSYYIRHDFFGIYILMKTQKKL